MCLSHLCLSKWVWDICSNWVAEEILSYYVLDTKSSRQAKPSIKNKSYNNYQCFSVAPGDDTKVWIILYSPKQKQPKNMNSGWILDLSVLEALETHHYHSIPYLCKRTHINNNSSILARLYLSWNVIAYASQQTRQPTDGGNVAKI